MRSTPTGISALLIGVIVLVLVLGIGAFTGTVPWLSTLVAAMLCGIAAAALAYRRPGESRTGAALISSASTIFLLFTFLSYWRLGSLNWWPLIDAATVVAAAWIGAGLGRRASTR